MKWKNYKCENGLYFVTIVLRDFIPLFKDEKVIAIVLNSLEHLRENNGLKIYAYVIMPDHIHMVVNDGAAANTNQNEQDKNALSSIIGQFKAYTSRNIAKYLNAEKPTLYELIKTGAYKGQNYAVWQETFRSVVIFDHKILAQKIN